MKPNGLKVMVSTKIGKTKLTARSLQVSGEKQDREPKSNWR